ncbi:MAG: dTDP-4-dehydrorhamnose reductase [Elusimicrobia bacterium]|nr:dTDP-4-dehydrorhamnose reductase [Elusimicrobiota bacterium]
MSRPDPIWLTGNKGMLGSEIEKLLIKSGSDFVSSDLEVDISDRGEVEKFLGDKKIKWIINAAAYTDVDGAESDKGTAFLINAEAVKNLAEIAAARSAGIVHISTDYVFGGKKEEGYTEVDETSPINTYGMSKLKGENYIRDILPEHYIIRTSWLYGAGGKNFVFTMMDLFNKRDEIKVVSDQRGSPTYAVDLAEAVMRIISREDPRYGIYNFSNEGSCSWWEFARTIYGIGRRLGLLKKDVNILPVDTSAFPLPAARPAYSLLIKDKIKNELGVTVRNWDDALEDFMRSAEFLKKVAGILPRQEALSRGSSLSAESEGFSSAGTADPNGLDSEIK